MSLTDAERAVLERRRTGPEGLSRAAAAMLLDRAPDEARRQLIAEEEVFSRDLARALPPDPQRFGFSPCDFAMLASVRVLCRTREARELAPLRMAFEPPFSTTHYTGCGPVEREPALMLLAFLAEDEPRAARHLVRIRHKALPLLDSFLTQTLSLMIRGRGQEVPALFKQLEPQYVAAMAQGLWRTDPEAFLHVRLLAALQVGQERGLIDLASLPDAIPYVPLGLLTGRS
ncbi:hypothetical protein D7X55_00315 [Corallococcus sp. AB049A]|uniref:Uncharacterized protein n=1 Tax=Corallococcus interemptor TaxID=2316720 RepID=A0A3A8R2U2_9BACT|nr:MULTISPECIES: hypothetical protein [Corallococcus]RKH53103.1 hypothetical protein D7Y23_04400 [Corallococcus sp. AB050B]RKH73105.1 hypothetical protein D7X96_03375 [Corallococcus interemptor]RKI75411.1 hypothetical protein D7X55_00315 [Corallococcus sp. AB049A]